MFQNSDSKCILLFAKQINELATDKRFMNADDGADDTFTIEELSRLPLDKKRAKAKAVIVALLDLKRIASLPCADDEVKAYYILW